MTAVPCPPQLLPPPTERLPQFSPAPPLHNSSSPHPQHSSFPPAKYDSSLSSARLLLFIQPSPCTAPPSIQPCFCPPQYDSFQPCSSSPQTFPLFSPAPPPAQILPPFSPTPPFLLSKTPSSVQQGPSPPPRPSPFPCTALIFQQHISSPHTQPNQFPPVQFDSSLCSSH